MNPVLVHRVLLVILVIVFASSRCFNISEPVRFYKDILCDVHPFLLLKCMHTTNTSVSIEECCIRCASDIACVGASINTTDGTCYLHTKCPDLGGCYVEAKSFTFFRISSPRLIPTTPSTEELCVHGVWNSFSNRSCLCKYPYVGERCERLPKSCKEFVTYGYNIKYERMAMNLSGYDYLKFVNCEFDGNEIRTLLARNSGGYLDFNRTWEDFVEGFDETYRLRDMHTDFWLGLKAMNHFSEPGVTDLVIRVRFADQDFNMTEEIFRYGGAVIGDASTNYELRVADYTKTIQPLGNYDITVNASMGNCLRSFNVAKFSTWDADHDDDHGRNCALMAGAGWWFNNCDLVCNPLGKFCGAKIERHAYGKYIFTPVADDGCTYNVTEINGGNDYVQLPGVDKETIENSLVNFEMYLVEYY